MANRGQVVLFNPLPEVYWNSDLDINTCIYIERVNNACTRLMCCENRYPEHTKYENHTAALLVSILARWHRNINYALSSWNLGDAGADMNKIVNIMKRRSKFYYMINHCLLDYFGSGPANGIHYGDQDLHMVFIEFILIALLNNRPMIDVVHGYNHTHV